MSLSRLVEMIERIVLGLIVFMTIGAIVLELIGVYHNRTIAIADILLLFLYTEVLMMVGIFFQNNVIPLLYPIFIAITALARLIVLQGKEMAPENILYEAASILILALAILLLRAKGVQDICNLLLSRDTGALPPDDTNMHAEAPPPQKRKKK